MYQPRRTAEASAPTSGSADAFVAAPRRAARSRFSLVGSRVAPTVVSVALLAAAGGVALNVKANETAQAAVAAPVREADPLSRDTVRTALETEQAPATDAASADVADAEELAEGQTEAPAEGEQAEGEQADVAAEGEQADAATEGEKADEAEVSAEGNAAEGAEGTEPVVGAAEFVGGQWAAAFGAAAGEKYAQVDLIVRAQPNGDAERLGTLKEADKVSITDRVDGKYRQVGYDGKVGYVLNSRLGDAPPVKPEPPAPAPAAASTPKGTNAGSAKAGKASAQAAAAGQRETNIPAPGRSVLGLKPKAMVVYNAVTARWSFSSIGGYRATNNRSNHGQGGAIDFMLTPGRDSAKGWAVANYLAANASAFQIDHIIFEQKIWTPYRPYWRPMANRGSITANHYDHVHVSVKL